MLLYGLICTALGQTPNVVGEILMPDAMDLLKYWSSYPPPHLLMRGQAGVSIQTERSRTPEEMMSDLSGIAGVKIRKGRN